MLKAGLRPMSEEKRGKVMIHMCGSGAYRPIGQIKWQNVHGRALIKYG